MDDPQARSPGLEEARHADRPARRLGPGQRRQAEQRRLRDRPGDRPEGDHGAAARGAARPQPSRRRARAGRRCSRSATSCSPSSRRQPRRAGAIGSHSLLPFRRATEDYAAKGRSAALAIDGITDTGWSIEGAVGKPHRAVFELKEKLGTEAGTLLHVTMHQEFIHQMTIGRFRLSATTDARPVSASSLPAEVEEAPPGPRGEPVRGPGPRPSRGTTCRSPPSWPRRGGRSTSFAGRCPGSRPRWSSRSGRPSTRGRPRSTSAASSSSSASRWNRACPRSFIRSGRACRTTAWAWRDGWWTRTTRWSAAW